MHKHGKHGTCTTFQGTWGNQHLNMHGGFFFSLKVSQLLMFKKKCSVIRWNCVTSFTEWAKIKASSLQSPPPFRFTWECWHINCSACTHTLSSPRGLLGACGSNCWLSHHWSLGARDSAAGRAYCERSTTVDCSDDSDAFEIGIWDKKKKKIELKWIFFLPLC